MSIIVLFRGRGGGGGQANTSVIALTNGPPTDFILCSFDIHMFV